ncbi:MAG: hypothetical protein NTW38_05090 [Candidatus Aminicenantes bacterium]|nr:hypothetical protein [Candidatus Aminicenantes bacterium]
MTMKKIIAFIGIAILAVGSASAGVTKSQKSEITFKGFGTMTSSSTEMLAADRKLSDNNIEFEGKGLLGGLAGKTMFRSGHTGDFIDLTAMTTAQIDHKKKTYTVTPIEKWTETQKEAQNTGQTEDTGTEKKESPIRIVKSEFKVEDTGESKTINGFACKKYLALWTVEWENIETGDKGTDKLETATWTTPMTNDLAAAQAEEMAFSQSYLKAVGLDTKDFQKDVLGTQWLGLLAAFDPINGQSQMTVDSEKLASEMSKIQGYPIVIDGKYFPMPKFKKAESEPSTGGGIAGKVIGGLFKKKAKPEEENAPAVAFYTEITALSASALDPASIQVPAGYKQK